MTRAPCATKCVEGDAVKIILMSVFVDDQEKAKDFYTRVLGFLPKNDSPVGNYRWLTVVSPEGPDDVELLLEPNDNPIAQAYQQGLHAQKIAAATFGVEDVHREYVRLKELGVQFTLEPAKMGPVNIAVFDDTCGNLIQIASPA